MSSLESFIDQAKNMARAAFIEKIRNSVANEGFDWIALAEMVTEEHSPLQSILDGDTVNKANLYLMSIEMSQQAGLVHAEPVKPDGEKVE